MNSENKKTKSKKIALFLVSVFILGVLVAGVFWVFNNSDDNSLTSEEAISRTRQLTGINDEIAEAVKIENLSDEDKETLSVYSEAENGDWVVFFQDSKRVSIYDPSEDRVIRTDLVRSQSSDSGQQSITQEE